MSTDCFALNVKSGSPVNVANNLRSGELLAFAAKLQLGEELLLGEHFWGDRTQRRSDVPLRAPHLRATEEYVIAISTSSSHQ